MRALGSKVRVYGKDRIEEYEKKNKHNKRFVSWDDPNIIPLFKKHCEDGWSPRMFCKYLRRGQFAFDMIRSMNPEFERVNRMYAKNGACKKDGKPKGI